MLTAKMAGAALLGLACIVSPSVAQAQAPRESVRPPLRSWTADRKEFAVGDVITVLIDEYTLASANKGTFASDRRQRDMSVGAGGSIPTPLPTIGADVSSSSDAQSQQRGENTQQNRFQGEMTVRVTEMEGNLLRVEGLKVVDIDGSRQELTLRGWVRPNDVSPRNVVDSWRLGDAELIFAGTGTLGKPKGGLITRMLGALWP